MQYRRSNLPGGTYFFTVNLAERKRRLLIEQIEILRRVASEVKKRHPFLIDGFVILPDHLHAMWTMPPGDADYPLRWMLIKAGFSRRLKINERRSASRIDKGERGIWQRRYWEHTIRDMDDYRRHLDYIHYNPVKHGYVSRAADWPNSSIHRYIETGMIDCDWAGHKADFPESGYGER
jgi:putative transposase